MKHIEKYTVGSFHLGDITICKICGKLNCTHLSGWKADKSSQKAEYEKLVKHYAIIQAHKSAMVAIKAEPYPYSKLIRVIK